MEHSVPCSWIQIRIGDTGFCVTGNTPSTKDSSNYGGGIPYIKPPQLNNKIVSVGDESLSEKGAKLARVLPKNSVLISCIGNLGKTALNTVPVAFNQQINAIIPNNAILSKFLFYQAQSTEFRHQLEEKATATTISIVNKSNFEKILVNIAPLNEQKRIVAKIEELFSELDNGIAALKTAREQLKVYRQAVLKHAFEGKLTAKWREKNADKLESPEQLLARIQQEREARYQQQLEDWKAAVNEWEANGKEGKKPGKPKEPPQLELLESTLPIGWLTVSLNWLLTTEKKPMTTGPFGTALKKSEHQPRGVSVLGIENIGNGKFLSGNKIFVTEEKAEELVPFKVHSGDIIISRSGTVGEICEVPEKVNNALISTNLLRVSLDNTFILSPFFVLMFQGGNVKLQVKDLCKGSSREFLNQSILSLIKYPVCGLEEQKALLKQLELIFANIEQQEKEILLSLEKAETLRQSVLKKAFSGQLVPQDLSDEPASELLARIQAEKEFVNTQKTKKTNKKQSVSGH